MTIAKEDNTFEQVLQKFEPQSKLLRTWNLQGGVSAQVTALEVERPDGRTKKLLVRRHGEIDLKHNPHIAANEFRLLQQLRAYGLLVPTPYYLDQSGEIFSTPYIVLEYIEGEPEFSLAHLPDLIPQIVEQLARIHQVDGSKLDMSLLPEQEKIYAALLRTRPTKLDTSFERAMREKHRWFSRQACEKLSVSKKMKC